MAEKLNQKQNFLKGIIKDNPVFVMLLGMCPTLGVTSSAFNGLGMGIATLFVLLMSNLVVSIIKSQIPSKVRIPDFVIIIASFVTIVEMVLEAYIPFLFEQLGIFIPLIVVNCLILGCAEAFARRWMPWVWESGSPLRSPFLAPEEKSWAAEASSITDSCRRMPTPSSCSFFLREPLSPWPT